MKKNIRILLFGAGKIGRRWITYFRDWGIAPEGILDNNKDLWGTMYEGIMVYDPSMIKTFDLGYICITCKREQEIFQQLLELGVNENKIITGSHNIINHLLYSAVSNMVSPDSLEKERDSEPKIKVLFDLYNGMVLGGVESWSYELAKKLQGQGYPGMYLARNIQTSAVTDEIYPVYMFENTQINSDKDKINMYVTKIAENLPCVMVCNFPQYIFWAACIAKSMYPEQIRIIAVQHSDDHPYYNAYSLWQKYIDKCMVISSRIKQKLLSYGMEQDKIGCLEWSIPCRKRIDRIWSKENTCLQIGYAGRVTVIPKRIDLFFPLAERLKRKGMKFQINIAGTGDYSENLQDIIQKEGFQDCMVCMGYIDRQDIPDFWSRQDIMISCSEWEGRSISQSEAMAEGAVPVITDVSGARDDVSDGYNGYVVAVGDLDALADRIQELYIDRDKLEQMGIRAHNTIYERQKNMDQGVFWDNLIKKVWKE